MITKVDFSNFYKLISKAFWPVLENKSRVRVLKGGAGSGKSYTIFLEMLMNIAVHACNYLVVRQTAKTNKTSTYALTKKLISDLGLWPIFKENKSEMCFTCVLNGAMVYYKGLDDVEKIKSVAYPGASGVLERIIWEEASEGNYNDFKQLNLRLRGGTSNFFQITLLLNPVSSMNWVKKAFYDSNVWRAYKHHSTYLDNEFIDKDYQDTLASYKEIDANFYKVYALGEWGETKGLIFNNWEVGELPLPREEIEESRILAGCDWGYNHPSVITLSYIAGDTLYTFDELVAYETTNSDYIKLVDEFKFISKTQRVAYDSAEPARGKEFVKAGFQFVPAKKTSDSVMRTIDYLKSFRRWVIVEKRCPRLILELQQYKWREDKDGNPLDEPVALKDDAIASVRYAITHLAFMKLKPGVLSGAVSEEKKGLIEKHRTERKERDLVRQKIRERRKELRAKEKLLKAGG